MILLNNLIRKKVIEINPIFESEAETQNYIVDLTSKTNFV